MMSSKDLAPDRAQQHFVPCRNDLVDHGEVSVTIRSATAEDADAAAELMIRARHAAVPAIPAPVHSDAEIREWFTAFVMAEQDVWVATSKGTVDAVLVLTEGWIEHLYVDPIKTDRGIGSVLVDHAKAISAGELTLWTFAENTGARRFYERHGFVAIDSTPGDNEENAPDVKYRWRRAGQRPRSE